MIVCHPRKLIFVKTLKVGGTSFEVALSKFCSGSCVITPLSDVEERSRKLFGGRAPQNFQHTFWADFDFRSPQRFYEHSEAHAIKQLVPPEIWDGYRKIAIVRNPYEVAISMYYYRLPELPDDTTTFDRYVQSEPRGLKLNARIAPLQGEAKMDHYIRYERLGDDLHALELGDVFDVFRRIRMKSTSRPKEGADVASMYARYPQAAAAIAAQCAEEIAFFGYDSPIRT